MPSARIGFGALLTLQQDPQSRRSASRDEEPLSPGNFLAVAGSRWSFDIDNNRVIGINQTMVKRPKKACPPHAPAQVPQD
jgi:hypothetical protein